MCAAAARIRHALIIVVHRVELLDQTSIRLQHFGLDHDIIHQRQGPTGKRIALAMAQTLRRRYQDGIPYDHVFIDEAHRDEHKVIHENPPRRLFGFTATPWRRDRPMAQWYDHMIVATNYQAAIQDGYIVRAKTFAPSIPDLAGIRTTRGDFDEHTLAERMAQDRLIGDIVDQWKKLATGEKTIVFCVNITHATKTLNAFQAAGIPSAIVTGETPAAERQYTMAKFRAGNVRVIVNVAVYIEGLDVHDCACIVLARPTQSLSFYMQMAGRACRAFPGKGFYKVLDHSGNVFRFGSPDINRDWDLNAAPNKRARTENQPGVRYCPRCFYVFSAGVKTCPNCAAPVSVPEAPTHAKGQLVEVAVAKPSATINHYDEERKHLYRIAGARGFRGRDMHQFVARELGRQKAVQRKDGSQIIIPQNPLLLW